MSENKIDTSDLIYPMFLIDGKQNRTDRFDAWNCQTPLDNFLKEAKRFKPCSSNSNLSQYRSEFTRCRRERGDKSRRPSSKAVREIKKYLPELGVMTDVAPDPIRTMDTMAFYDSGYILNDETVKVL